MGQNCKPYMVLWYLLSIHSSSNQNERRLTAQTHVLVHRAQALANQGGCHLFYMGLVGLNSVSAGVHPGGSFSCPGMEGGDGARVFPPPLKSTGTTLSHILHRLLRLALTQHPLYPLDTVLE
jgi:hypothetical protein